MLQVTCNQSKQESKHWIKSDRVQRSSFTKKEKREELTRSSIVAEASPSLHHRGCSVEKLAESGPS